MHHLVTSSIQRYSSLNNYLKYSMAPCQLNHGHISFKWYVIMFEQRLLLRFSCPLNHATDHYVQQSLALNYLGII